MRSRPLIKAVSGEKKRMKNIDSFLACVEVNSIAFGYSVLAKIAGVPGVRILEGSPAGARFVILALSERDDLKRTLSDARAALDGPDASMWLDTEICEGGVVAEGLYALPVAPLSEALVVVEAESVSGLIASADTLVHGHGLSLIELKILRSSTGGAYGFFTGAIDACRAGAEAARARLRDAVRKGRVEVIENLSPEFRRHFELGG